MFASLALMMAAAVQDVPAAPQPPPPKPKLICRGDQQVVGSHIHTGRRCKTAEEWQAEDQRLQETSPSARVTDRQSDDMIPRTPRPPL